MGGRFPSAFCHSGVSLFCSSLIQGMQGRTKEPYNLFQPEVGANDMHVLLAPLPFIYLTRKVYRLAEPGLYYPNVFAFAFSVQYGYDGVLAT